VRSLALALALLSAGAAQAAPGLQLYPVKGVFFPSEEGPSRIDADFRSMIEAGEQPYFATKFREKFPEAAKTIAEGTQRRTFAVSLQIARASRYTVAKTNGTVDMYLPVTASVYFTNVMTGEVLYAATRTTIKMVNVMPENAKAGGDKTKSLFADTFHGVVDDLIGDAKERFKPQTVSAKVEKEWKGVAILGGGTNDGLRRDDTLTDEKGNELKVLHAGPDYAVASPTLGTFSKGTVFAKASNGTLAEIQKPRMLPLIEQAPAGFPEESLVQLFGDALGAAAPVSLVPVNRTYAEVVKALSTQIDLSKEKLTQRELPAFFVRLRVPDPITYERATKVDYMTGRITDALAYAEVVDRSGRVLYAAQGRDHIEDEVVNGQALNLEARQEIAIKNALLALAKRFGAEFKLKTAQFELAEAGALPSVKDENGLLAAGAMVHAFKKIGKVGNAKDVLVPTWELSVAVPGEEKTELSPTFPLINDAPELAKGDVLIVEGASGVDARRRRFGTCGPAEKLGTVEVPGYTELAFNLFAQGYKVPFYAGGLAATVRALVHGGTGFKEDIKFAEPKVDYCIQPVYRISTGEPKCSGKTCSETATVKLSYRVRPPGGGGEVKASVGMESKMTASALPTAASAESKAIALQADLVDEILKVAPAAAAGLAEKKL
jgi:hypothetical protein